MKQVHLISLLILSVSTSFAQTNPKIAGRARELSIAPDKTIWLTTETGNIYHTKITDSIWQTNLQFNPNTNYLTSAPNMDRILFFNSDTAIIYGYITKNFYEEKKIRFIEPQMVERVGILLNLGKEMFG